MIKEIYDLKAVLSSDANLFFFDLEDTVLASNIYYDLIGHRDYSRIFLDLCKDVKVFDVTYLGKNYKRRMMQDDIPEIINELRNRGAKIFALTSGYPSHQKKLKIRKLGIRFDGFLFTRGADKGPFLLKFLENNVLSGKCSFIDNHYEKINNVQESFANEPIDLFLYKREYIHRVSEEDFKRYWLEVIEGVKRGEVEKLKILLQKEKEKKLKQKEQRLDAMRLDIADGV